MIVSHEWVRQFVPHTQSPEEVGELLSRHCVTLDGLTRRGTELEPFVVAQVVEAARHPNSDRLWVTKVDDGSGTLLDVVCGAPNVVAGHKYPFARTGTVMPGGLRIEQRKIRGETSNGMLCSARELGLGEEHDGILRLETEAAPGTPLLQVLPVADAQLDLDVLPNRPDLLSHRGVARELAAITGAAFRERPADDITAADPAVPAVTGERAANAGGVVVRVEDAASCPLYVAMVLRGVTVGPSPAWLRARLEGIGQRSINNVVDATNYLLHGFGQPVHAFDLDRLSQGTIVVRPTRAGEGLVTLDGVPRAVAAGTTVICDGERPVALAGVMGGRDSEVGDATRNVLLEVAVFAPSFVRRVRRAVGVQTDAAYRFERGIDGGATEAVARLGAALIAQVAGGVVEAMLVVGRPPEPAAPFTVRPDRVARLLGVPVSTDEITHRLTSLGCVVTRQDGRLQVQPPSWRHDLLREVDAIEEVARLIGFDQLPDELRPFRPGTVPDDPLHVSGRRVRDVLVASGLAEVRPMPFTSTGGPDAPRVRNPLAEDEPFLRSSLLDTLARRAEYNLARMQGHVRLFEIGNAFLPAAGRLPREEVRAAALLMGARRPPHFSEPQPPSFDQWDARHLAERMVAAAFPGRAAHFEAAGEAHAWRIVIDGSPIGRVGPVAIDRPEWASAAFGVEVTLGVMPSDDVAPAGRHAHSEAPSRPASIWSGIRYRPLPSTPAAEFDLALVVPHAVYAADVEAAMRQAVGDLLERVLLFDEYEGAGVPPGTRSLAWRLTLRHPERTLRDKEIEGRRARLLEVLDRELGVRPRAS
jgi:phenylalanyl-tRNA synthetase beta chain